MVKISPSILSADFANLERDIRRVASADYLHVDVMDGAFVPNLTIGVPVVKSIRKCTDMFLDVHLMIDKPVRYIEAFAKAGADLLSVHLEADHPTQIAQALKLISLFFVFWGLLYVFRGILNGAGNAGFALVSGILEVVGRMGCAFLLTSIPFIGQWGIWLAEGLTWILVSAAGAICYFRGKWTQKKLIA